MKKSSLLLIVILFLFIGCSCFNESKIENKKVESKNSSQTEIKKTSEVESSENNKSDEKKLKITVLSSAAQNPKIEPYHLKEVTKNYANKNNLEVEIEIIRESNVADMKKKFNTKLYTGNVGDIVFFDMGMETIKTMMDSDAFINLNQELKNHKNILESVKYDSYAPMHIKNQVYLIDYEKADIKKTKESLKHDYESVIKKIREEKAEERILTVMDYDDISIFFNNIKAENDDNIKINKEELKSYFEKVKKELKDYKKVEFLTDEEYKKWLVECDMDIQMKVSNEYWEKGKKILADDEFAIAGIFNLRKIKNLTKFEKLILINLNTDRYVDNAGYMIPKSSKNKKSAIKYLDYMLSYEGQKDMYVYFIENSANNSYKGPSIKQGPDLMDKYDEENNFGIPKEYKDLRRLVVEKYDIKRDEEKIIVKKIDRDFKQLPEIKEALYEYAVEGKEFTNEELEAIAKKATDKLNLIEMEKE